MSSHSKCSKSSLGMNSSSEAPSSPKQPKAAQSTAARNTSIGLCHGCKLRKYELSTHVVVLDKDGRVGLPRRVAEVDKTLKFSDSDERALTRSHSTENVYNINSPANLAINYVRNVNQQRVKLRIPICKSEDQKQFVEFSKDKQATIKFIIEVCKQAETIFDNEPRVLRVHSPCFVIGGIHGNLRDLINMEQQLWPTFPLLPSCYVFLGDYVNCGDFSVECALYLLAMKVLTPNKVRMSRPTSYHRSICRCSCCAEFTRHATSRSSLHFKPSALLSTATTLVSSCGQRSTRCSTGCRWRP